MPSNIKNNSVRSLRFRCRNDEYYDFMLQRDECYGGGAYNNCIVAGIDANAFDYPIGKQVSRDDKNGKPTVYGGEIFSRATYGDSNNLGVTLNNIGLTGIDNGFISYRRDLITNREFYDMYTGTTYTVPVNSLFLSPVSGNTDSFVYPMTFEEDCTGKYFSMKGGFFQGFFKLYGFDYQTLPSYIEDNWSMRFVLRRRSDYPLEVNTINNLHKENNGIFFYMGTRAENKFWEKYNSVEDKAEFLLPSVFNDGYFDDCYLDNYTTAPDYTYYLDNCEDTCCPFESEYMEDWDVWCPEYIERDLDLSEVDVDESLGIEVDKHGYYEIETDNKFIFFNRTCTGFTVNNWEDEYEYSYDDCNNVITPKDKDKPVVVLTGITDNCKENKFITYNRTCTGKTVNTPYQETYNEYDIFKDIKNNAFALRIDEDGRIGYKYGTAVCDEPHNYGVVEEYSKPGIIPDNEWVTIDVRFEILNTSYKQCFVDGGQTVKTIPNNVGKRKMKIYIYVNGYLKLISKELDEFNFRELNDIYQKQEGVPYSISLGGGTLGLLETVSLNYYLTSQYCLPIERDFAGTFLGDIKLFEFSDCFIDLQSMRDSILKSETIYR